MNTIIYNGKIYTFENNRIVEALLIEDEVITALGTNEEILALKDERTLLFDCKSRTVIPGFNDSHMHLYSFGLGLQMVNLLNVTSKAEVANKVRSYITEHKLPKGSWVRGRGWNQDYFSDKSFITRQELDFISADYPLVLSRACGHVLVVNTLALKLCNIDENTEKVQGGEFDYNLGIFRENAMSLILDNIPIPTISDVKKTIEEAMHYANTKGLTSIQTDDLSHIPNGDFNLMLKAYEELRNENKLTCRIYEQCLLDKEQLQRLFDMGYNTGHGDNYFKIGPLKILSDGSLGARTAALMKAYADDSSSNGIMCFTEEELYELIELAHKNNMQIAIHCIGDRAMNTVFNAYEKVLKLYSKINHRHGIIHCQITDRVLLNRFKELNVLAYVQPIFLHYDMHIVEDRVGKELASKSYAFKTLQDLNVHVAYGTDCPVEALDPLPNIYCAVTRKDLTGSPDIGWNPQEKVAVKDAFRNYTIGSAYASFEEDIKGSLSLGKLGDLVVLNRDPLKIKPEEIKDIQVDATFVGGKPVYQR